MRSILIIFIERENICIETILCLYLYLYLSVWKYFHKVFHSTFDTIVLLLSVNPIPSYSWLLKIYSISYWIATSCYSIKYSNHFEWILIWDIKLIFHHNIWSDGIRYSAFNLLWIMWWKNKQTQETPIIFVMHEHKIIDNNPSWGTRYMRWCLRLTFHWIKIQLFH